MIPIKDTQPSRSTPIITYLLIISNVVIFWFEMQLNSTERELLIYRCGLVPAYYSSGLAFTIPGLFLWINWITHMFLHGSLLHLLGNMWTLWIFGDNVEDRMGKIRFILFYLLCGLGAAFTQYVINPMAKIPMIGASGAISGVMGAYFCMFPRSWILTIVPPFLLSFVIPAPIFLFYWFIIQWIGGLVDWSPAGGIAWWAHIGGFATGILVHRFFLHSQYLRYPKYYCWQRAKEV